MLAVSNVSRRLRAFEGYRMKIQNLVIVSPTKYTEISGPFSRPEPRLRPIFSKSSETETSGTWNETETKRLYVSRPRDLETETSRSRAHPCKNVDT